MANLRTGKYGQYYGSYLNESEHLSEDECEQNAKYIYSFLSAQGWSINAISAIVGNMYAESSINPGRWQSDSVGWESGGYGLVQWTPTTKYLNWCSENNLSDPSEIDNNLARIIYELENGLQFYGTGEFSDMTFREFSTSEISCGTLAIAFLLCYERPADQSESVQAYRASLANKYYDILSGSEPSEPIEPTPSKTKKKKFNFLLFNRRNKVY